MRNENKSASALILHRVDGRVICISLTHYRVDGLVIHITMIQIFWLCCRVDVVLAIHAVVLSENDSYISK